MIFAISRAFSGHCETSRRFVGSSSGQCGLWTNQIVIDWWDCIGAKLWSGQHQAAPPHLGQLTSPIISLPIISAIFNIISMQKYWQKVRYKRHKKTKMCIVYEISLMELGRSISGMWSMQYFIRILPFCRSIRKDRRTSSEEFILQFLRTKLELDLLFSS